MSNRIQIQTLSVAGQAPTALADGELAVNLADTPPTLFVGSGGAVERVGPVVASATAPVGPVDGALWMDSA